MNESQLGTLSRTYQKIGPHWPGLIARERQVPPPHEGKPAFWWLKADIGSLMKEGAKLADD